MLPRLSLRNLALACSLAASALVSAPLQAAPAEGKVIINYNRCDKDYDGWATHLWRNPGIPLPGIEWSNPMMPTGNNDFGIYWETDLDLFGKSGTVNYIIHKGDTKEQSGRDMKFDGNKHPEVWILSKDRKIYYTLEKAQAARAEDPCK